MRRIELNQKYGTAKEIEGWLKKEKDAKIANRLNAIRLLQIGHKHKAVIEICRVGCIAYKKWVQKWNLTGREGLVSNGGGVRSTRVFSRDES